MPDEKPDIFDIKFDENKKEIRLGSAEKYAVFHADTPRIKPYFPDAMLPNERKDSSFKPFVNTNHRELAEWFVNTFGGKDFNFDELIGRITDMPSLGEFPYYNYHFEIEKTPHPLVYMDWDDWHLFYEQSFLSDGFSNELMVAYYKWNYDYPQILIAFHDNRFGGKKKAYHLHLKVRKMDTTDYDEQMEAGKKALEELFEKGNIADLISAGHYEEYKKWLKDKKGRKKK